MKVTDYYDYRDAVFASDLSSTQKLVALAIAYHYNWKKQSPAFPSNKTLSNETSLGVSTIVKAKKTLVEKGWMLSSSRYNDSSEYTPTISEHYPCSQIETNNEYNNEVNNEINNEYKASDEALVSNLFTISKENSSFATKEEMWSYFG